jgi:hypothetical protein
MYQTSYQVAYGRNNASYSHSRSRTAPTPAFSFGNGIGNGKMSLALPSKATETKASATFAQTARLPATARGSVRSRSQIRQPLSARSHTPVPPQEQKRIHADDARVRISEKKTELSYVRSRSPTDEDFAPKQPQRRRDSSREVVRVYDTSHDVSVSDTSHHQRVRSRSVDIQKRSTSDRTDYKAEHKVFVDVKSGRRIHLKCSKVDYDYVKIARPLTPSNSRNPLRSPSRTQSVSRSSISRPHTPFANTDAVINAYTNDIPSFTITFDDIY